MYKIYILALTISTLMLSSCEKDLEDRIIGEWDANINYEIIVEETYYGEETQIETSYTDLTAIYYFYENGTGKTIAFYPGANESGDSFKWVATENNVILDYDDESIATVDFEVLKNEKKEQKWKSSISVSFSDEYYTSETVIISTVDLSKR